MSCTKRNSVYSEKPLPTYSMKKREQIYVWREQAGNPNIFCWVPVSKKLANPIDLDEDELSIQDIPPPTYDGYTDMIIQLAEEADDMKKRFLKKRAKITKKDGEIVSFDNPEKYTIVKEFIKEKGLKLYGGTAINMYLPPEARFYTEQDTPDYDVFSPSPWEDAMELSDLFYSKGYKYVEAKAGMHKGTYKVFVDLWPVADITYKEKYAFKRMETIMIDGLQVVSPLKLMEAMYKEFSEPFSNPSRWPKVAEREKLLNKWQPILGKKYSCSDTLFAGSKITIEPVHALLLETVYKFFIDKKMLFSGSLAYNTLIELGGGTKRLLCTSHTGLSETAHQDIQDLFTLLIKIYPKLQITTQYYPARDLNNTAYNIFMDTNDETKKVSNSNHVKICSIVHLTSCSPYQHLLNKYIVSIDYLKYELYDTAVFASDSQVREDAKCKLQYLDRIQNKYYHDKKITELDKSPFQRFITRCRGPYEETIKITFLHRWLERVAKKAEIITKYTNDSKIKIYPKKLIPTECLDLPKDRCEYPTCSWNKYINKCTGISSGIYRAGEDNVDIANEFVDNRVDTD